MGWAETRARARRAVHSTFSLPATYFAPGSEEGINCSVRMHNEMRMFGDLDREMFAQVMQDKNQLVFNTLETTPKKRGLVKIYGDADRTALLGEFEIANLLPKTDEFLRVEVTLK